MTATDSQLALHHELRRTHPHLTLYWGVADQSTLLPEGAVAVMMLHPRVVRRPRPRQVPRHQRGLRALVLPQARAEGAPDLPRIPRQVDGDPDVAGQELHAAQDRGRAATGRSRDWDLILTPAPEMDAVLPHGVRLRRADPQPRLPTRRHPRQRRGTSGPRAHAARCSGSTDHQTVVLYAPTWRDDLATSYRSSPLVGHLDLETSSKALGDDYVLLMRGHRFHPGQRRSAEKARLIDVTDYPEINDLILACGRRRPRLLVAPFRLRAHRTADALPGPRPGPATPVARAASSTRSRTLRPAPWSTRADRVVELLRDLDGVRRDHAEEYERFNATYNYLQDGRSAERVVRSVLLLVGSVRLSRASGPPARSSSASPLRCTSRRCPRGRTAHVAARRRSGS